VTPDDFRRLALAFEGAAESAHQGHPDFRARGQVFATLDVLREGASGGFRPGEGRLGPKGEHDGAPPRRLAGRGGGGARGRLGAGWEERSEATAPRAQPEQLTTVAAAA
jgi:hypothetical protein